MITDAEPGLNKEDIAYIINSFLKISSQYYLPARYVDVIGRITSVTEHNIHDIVIWDR